MSETTPQQRLTALTKELDDSLQKATALDAVIAERRARSVKLQTNISQALYRMGLQPKVEAYMLSLQQRVHQRSVGLYEQLLTALVQDVLPENPHPISLELDTDKGLPALSIQLGKNEFAQDIYEDTGGSLTNVVSSGLRFVALARSNLRRFLVLDEPDCWIESWRVPRFADILSEMATRIHVQGILISHHQDSAFINLPDRMKLEKNANGIIEVRKSRTAVWADDKAPGIRWIRLERFMSHLDTKLELGPGINVLSGANHIGKSAIVNALRVFCYHQGADRHIMHGHDNFVISIGIEDGQVLTCTRVRKGGRKTVYSYMNPSMKEPRVEPADKAKVPEFVVNALNIQKLNDLDIQLSHQKMPVFLLNEPKTKQAALLSAGMESDHVRTMLKDYKSWMDGDRGIVRNDEKEMLVLKKGLDEWDAQFAGAALADQGLNLQTMRANLEQSIERVAHMEELVRTMQYADALEAALPAQTLIDAPMLTPTDGMRSLAQVWKTALLRTECEPTMTAPVAPSTEAVVEQASMLRNWKGAEKRAAFLEQALTMAAPQEPKLDTRGLAEVATAWQAAETQCTKAEENQTRAANDLVRAQEELDALLAQTGGTCPLCHQGWPHAHEEGQETA